MRGVLHFVADDLDAPAADAWLPLLLADELARLERLLHQHTLFQQYLDEHTGP